MPRASRVGPIPLQGGKRDPQTSQSSHAIRRRSSSRNSTKKIQWFPPGRLAGQAWQVMETLVQRELGSRKKRMNEAWTGSSGKEASEETVVYLSLLVLVIWTFQCLLESRVQVQSNQDQRKSWL